MAHMKQQRRREQIYSNWNIVERETDARRWVLSIEHKYCKKENRIVDFPYTWLGYVDRGPLPRLIEQCVHCDEDFPDGIKLIVRLRRL